MKVSIKKIDVLKRELSFEVPQDRVSQKQGEVYKEFAKSVKVKGFRPGKAPREIIETQYGLAIREETMKKLIPEAYQEGLATQNIAPLDYPEIKDVDWKDGMLVFKAVIEIKPEVKLGNYKGLKVMRKDNKVTDEEIEKTLEYFKKGQGKDAQTDIDDEFAKGLGYPSLEVFKESLARQMEMDKDRQNRIDVENQVADQLIKGAKMVVPQSLVAKQIEHRLGELTHRLSTQGLAQKDIEKKAEEMRKELKDPVEKDVKLYLIFDKIAQEENISVGEGQNLPQRVMEFLMKEAQWQEPKKEKK